MDSGENTGTENNLVTDGNRQTPVLKNMVSVIWEVKSLKSKVDGTQREALLVRYVVKYSTFLLRFYLHPNEWIELITIITMAKFDNVFLGGKVP